LEALYINYSATVVLVTGGTGFLGSILIKQLISSGHRVRATKRATSVIPSYLEGVSGLEWVTADINDFFAMADAFDGVTEAYHCAALISYHAADRKRMMTVNVEGTAHMVNLALEQGVRLLHVSSIAAMGRGKNGQATTEADLWEYDRHQSGYAVAKYEAEMEVWRGIAEGLEAVIVNPALIIGATAAASGNGSTGSIFAELHRGLNFYTTGSVGLIDVEDVARAMVLLMQNRAISGQRFLLSNVNMSHRELLARCSALLGRKEPRYRASRWMLGVAWRAAGLWSLISGRRPLLTREAAYASTQQMAFSNQKVIEATGIQFKPIDDTLREICNRLLTKK